MAKRQCAVCDDKTQANVVLKWRRKDDSVIFHICLLCAETNKVFANTVKMKKNKTYTTYNGVKI